MTLKYYILKSFMVLSLFITGMFVAGNVDPLHAAEAAAPEAVDITPAIEWIDSDDFAFCQPGESGRFEVKFMEMYGIQPEGTIEFFSGAPDYLEVTPDGKWTAKKGRPDPCRLYLHLLKGDTGSIPQEISWCGFTVPGRAVKHSRICQSDLLCFPAL